MLRIVSYNIHSGKDFLWRTRLNEMAATLLELHADIICLQEIHQNNRYGDQVGFFAQAFSMQSAFSPSIPLDGGGYGNALFTCLPIRNVETKKLPAKREARSLLQVSLTNNVKEINLWVTHLSLDKKSRYRQMESISQEIERRKNDSLILLGDFNTTNPVLPPSLIDSAKAANQTSSPTVFIPRLRLDYVFATADWHVIDYRVVDVRWSDHYPILVTLEQLGPSVPAR